MDIFTIFEHIKTTQWSSFPSPTCPTEHAKPEDIQLNSAEDKETKLIFRLEKLELDFFWWHPFLMCRSLLPQWCRQTACFSTTICPKSISINIQYSVKYYRRQRKQAYIYAGSWNNTSFGILLMKLFLILKKQTNILRFQLLKMCK